MYISYGLQGYVIVDIIWGHYLKSKFAERDDGCRYEYGLRYGIVTVSCKCECVCALQCTTDATFVSVECVCV